MALRRTRGGLNKIATEGNTTGRKLVYLLGAGASRGAGAIARVQAGGSVPIPMQGDFWDVFLRFCKGKTNRKIIEKFLFRYFHSYARVPSRARASARRSLLSKIDVEEVFTFLSERARAPSTSSQLRKYVQTVWAALVTEIGNVFVRFDANAATRRAYRTLLRNQIRSRDVVISFNYDRVFERSIPSSRRWAYGAVEDTTRALRILKPHGSVGWKHGKNGIQKSRTGTDAVVVAPTHLKFVATTDRSTTDLQGYLDQSTQLTEIWSSMEKHMRSAKALVFIGYSFPIADLYFSSLLRSVLAERSRAPSVIVVNPDAVAIAARLQERFSISDPTRLFDLHQLITMKRRDILQLAAGSPAAG